MRRRRSVPATGWTPRRSRRSSGRWSRSRCSSDDRETAADRFRLLEPLRQFGRERLREAGEETVLRDATRSESRSSRRSPERMTPGKSTHSSGSVSSEPTSGARSSSAFGTGRGGVGAAICRDLWIYWAAQGPATDVRRVLAALLELSPTPGRPRGALHVDVGCLLLTAGGSTAAIRMATEALEIGRAIVRPGNCRVGTAGPRSRGLPRHGAGTTRSPTPRSHVDLAGDAWRLAFRRAYGHGAARLPGATFRGELDEGIALANDGLRYERSTGRDVASVPRCFSSSRSRHSIAGEPAAADSHARRCLELKRDLGDLTGMASAVEALASIAWRLGAGERAATLLGAADAIWAIHPHARCSSLCAPTMIVRHPTHGRPWEAHVRGCPPSRPEMTRDEVVDYALEVRRPRPAAGRGETPPSGWPFAARDGSGGARGRRSHECTGGGASVHLRANGREPSGEHLQQAGRRLPAAGRPLDRGQPDRRPQLSLPRRSPGPCVAAAEPVTW